MNQIKSLFAFLFMLVATLFAASDVQAFALGNHAGGFFLGTLDCSGVDDSGTRNPCRENGWLNYDTLSGYCVAANKLDDAGLMQRRLQRLGYDDANTGRIMNSIKNGDQVVIVGENMKRVDAVANMVNRAGGNSVTYNPRNWSGMNRNSLEANRSWIRYWGKDKGATIIDIGRQPTPRPSGPSPFYGIENRSLNSWGIYTPFN